MVLESEFRRLVGAVPGRVVGETSLRIIWIRRITLNGL